MLFQGGMVRVIFVQPASLSVLFPFWATFPHCCFSFFGEKNRCEKQEDKGKGDFLFINQM